MKGVEYLKAQVSSEREQNSAQQQQSLDERHAALMALNTRLECEKDLIQEQKESLAAATRLLEQQTQTLREESARESASLVTEKTRLQVHAFLEVIRTELICVQSLQAALEAELSSTRQRQDTEIEIRRTEREQLVQQVEREREQIRIEQEAVETLRLQVHHTFS